MFLIPTLETKVMKQVSTLSILTAILIMITASTAGAVSNAAVLYLRVAAGARPAGMGEAFVSIADDATATYWNPAGLGNAPIAGQTETALLAKNSAPITDVVTMKSYNGKIETWVISGDRLLMYDGKTWKSGRPHMTSSDQTLTAFLKTIMDDDDPAKLKVMARRVVDANCDVTEEQVDAFIAQTRAHIPQDYAEMEELERGLDTLKSGYEACLLNPARFKSLQNKLKDGLKDSVFTSEELDKITFSLEQTILRFLPSQLTVPFGAPIVGHMTCLEATGSYLWVGTDNGLYRNSGPSWARYTTPDGLPADSILTLDEEKEHLMIGTVAGIGEYYHGAFNKFSDLPSGPVNAISFAQSGIAYAVINGTLFYYDGKTWTDSYSYKVRIDDSIGKIVDRIAVYHTQDEYNYLTRRIRELNAGNMPPAVSQPSDNAAPEVMEGDTTLAGEGENPDSAVTKATEEAAPAEPWLVEGNVIQLPYSPVFRYDVTALYADGLHHTVWVGTTSGLLSFDGQTWNRYGYKRFNVPGPDSSGQVITMTAEEIARAQYPMADSLRIATLAANIDDYNDLKGQPVSSGESVYIYSHNTGSNIYTIGSVFNNLYVSTEYSLEKLTHDGWEDVQIGGLHGQHYKGIYDFDGQAYYAAADGLGLETKGRREFVVMFTRWLPTLNLDMYYGFLSYVHNVRGLGTFGLSAIYLNYGTIEFRDEQGNPAGEGNPFEFAMGLSYGTSLNSKVKLGGTVKIIHSHLSSIGAGQEQGNGIAWDFAVDAGMLLKFTDRLQFGSALTNLGPDISYIDAAQADKLPLNLAMGLSYKLWDTPYNSLIVQGELNKMLVGLNKGIGREMEYAIRHIGAEYWYSNFIAIRAGYKFDKEGQVKHLTFGAGLQYGTARFDLAYVPSSVDSPLANTLRIAFSLMM